MVQNVLYDSIVENCPVVNSQILQSVGSGFNLTLSCRRILVKCKKSRILFFRKVKEPCGA